MKRQTIPAEARERLQRILGQLRAAEGAAEKMAAKYPPADRYPLRCGVYKATAEMAADDLEQVLIGFAPRPRGKAKAP